MRRAILICLLSAGCGGGGEQQQPAAGQYAELTMTARDKVDILFMVDNSPSMAPKQVELEQRFPQLLQLMMQAAADHPVDYHIGVVTSDLGAGPSNLNGNQCHPGGDGGKLQALGARAGASCVAPVGKNFIDWNQLDGTSNLPEGQDLSTTFACMASVGDQGCGFEMPLESVYRALHDPIAENADFLRADAALMVVFLTDEDDCSAPDDTDLFDPVQVQYGALLSYRCSQYGVACGAPATLLPYGDSGGELTSCAPATQAGGGKLIDVDKYVQFFAQAGGVKADPGDVQLVAIAAPNSPVSTVLANIKAAPGPYQTCAGPPDGEDCAVALQHSCVSPDNEQFFGDPAVRLSAVVSASRGNQITSICDTSYQQAMNSMGAQLIAREQGRPCFDAALADPPQCTVTVETTAMGGTVARSELPACASGQSPCWSLTTEQCPASQRVALTGVTIDTRTAVHARCLIAVTP